MKTQHRTMLCIAALGLVLATSFATDVAQADPPLGEQSHTCKVIELGVHIGSYAYVKCDSSWSNPSTSAKAHTFGVSGTEPNHVSQLLSIGHTSFNNSKKVTIRFGANDYLTGCSDCRKLTSIAVMN